MKKNTIMIPKMIILEFFGWCREREQRDLCEREREREAEACWWESAGGA